MRITLLYTTLLHLLLPLALLRLWWRGRRDGDYRRHWRERFGRLPAVGAKAQPRLWLHAVSVGEVNAAEPLLKALLARYPQGGIHLTTTTATGRRRALRLRQELRPYQERLTVGYAPFDLPWVVYPFIDALQPQALILLETELWPHWLRACRRRGTTVVIANARLSRRAVRRYGYLRGWWRGLLADALVIAQGRRDARRFCWLSGTRAVVGGNLKFDLTLPPALIERGQRWRQRAGQRRPVWLAASTHPGEEALLLALHRQLRQRYPELLLLLAPRHPHRADELLCLCARYQLPCKRHSDASGAQLDAAAVYLIDTLGELLAFYAAADLAFVGGSLVPHGGHNPIEPAALSVPVVSGPHTFNFQGIYRQLLAAQGAICATDAQALGHCLGEWLAKPSHARAIGACGARWAAAQRGSVKRHQQLIAQRLDARSPSAPPAG